MNKQLIALSLIATPGLIAQDRSMPTHEETSYSNDCCNNDCSCNSCCCEPCCVPQPKPCIDCECYTPAFYDLQCDCGFFADLAFLYWYARETNLPYAVTISVLADSQFPTNGTAVPVEYQQLSAKWDPGVRLGIGWNSRCDGWDYYLNWTYFSNNSSNSTTENFTNLVPFLGESGVLNPWIISSSVAAPIFNKVSAKWKLTFNQIDLELGRKYWLSRCFNLRPYAGLRSAWTKTELDLDSKLDVLNVGAPFIRNFCDDFTNKNWGIGFLAGIQPNFSFCREFILYGNINAALIWGKFDGAHKIRYLVNQHNIDGIPVISIFTNNSENEFYSMSTLIDVAIGLRWEDTWCCDRYRSALDLGWEHHIWFDHGTRQNMIGVSNVMRTNQNLNFFQDLVPISSNLVYGGFVLRARFEF